MQLQVLHEEVAAGLEERHQCQQQTEHVELKAARQDVELSEAKEAMEKLKEESWELREGREAMEAKRTFFFWKNQGGMGLESLRGGLWQRMMLPGLIGENSTENQFE